VASSRPEPNNRPAARDKRCEKRPTAGVHFPATRGHRPASGYWPATTLLQDISWPVISGERLTSFKVSGGGHGRVACQRSAASSLADASCHRRATGHGQAVCCLSATSKQPAARNLPATNGKRPLVICQKAASNLRPAIDQRSAVGQLTAYGQYTAASDLLQTAGLRESAVSRAATSSQTAASVNRPSGS
jgi:hypothetical protein